MGTILQWNCRGLMNNHPELCLLSQQYNPVAMCLQETHIADVSKVSFKGYTSYHKVDNSHDRASGGSSILVRNDIIHSPVNLNTNLQAVAVKITLSFVFTICSIYAPPNKCIDIKDLEHLLLQIQEPVMILGDFNSHNPLWGSDHLSPKGRVIETFISQNDLCLYNDGSSTFIHSGNGTYSAIDLSFASPTLFDRFSWDVHDDCSGSDHFPIILRAVENDDHIKPRRWKFKQADWTTFKTLCSLQLNKHSFESDDPVTDFSNILLEIADKTIPKSSISSKPRKPWFDDECKQAIKERKNSEKAFRRSPCHSKLSSFRIHRTKARRTIKQKKRASWKQFVSSINNRTPMNKIWNMINRIKGRKNSATVKHLTVNNNLITDKLDIANTLGEQLSFNSSSDQCSKQFLKHKRNAEKKKINFSSSNDEFYNKEFSTDELRLSLNRAHDTAEGPDKIHYQLLKHLPPESLSLLLDIYNYIWRTGDFPQCWSEAIVIPIPKPGKDHSDPNSYRPISLTSCVCKTLERMINDRLVWFLENNNILTDIQCGFRKRKSTIDHLVRLESFIRNAFLNKQEVVSIFFDLEKAYDTTWKYGILKDLHEAGLRGRMPVFISNFLENRNFRVRLGSILSDPFEQEMGVPQGSILSVTLFSLKINSLAKVLSNDVEGSLYVDDFLMSYRAKSTRTCERQLQVCLHKIEKWCKENGFKFSPSKSVCVHFHNKRGILAEPNLTLNGMQIRVVKETRFLGLIFDQKLSFIPHLKALKTKCLKALDIIKVVSNQEWGADKSVLLKLYRSLVRSKLDYGCIIYGSARPSYLKMLNTIHHQGLRLALGAFRTSPVESLYVEAGELPLEQRRVKLSLQYVTKLKSTPSNPAFNCVFRPEYENKYLRNAKVISPLGVRIKEHLENSNILIEEINDDDIYDIPPWELSSPIVNLTLHSSPKSDTHNTEYRQRFLEVNDYYENKNFVPVYTDGSKTDNYVSSSAVFPVDSFKVNLHEHTSIFTAEAVALKLAVQHIQREAIRKSVIYSDSLSCLQALQHKNLQNPIIREIIHILSYLGEVGSQVEFCWIPGHVGIKGNEKADNIARRHIPNNIYEIKAPYSDFKPRISQYVNSLFQAKWNVCVENKLHEINEDFLPSLKMYSDNRKEDIILTRLRIGHSRLTHKHYLANEDPPECIPCNTPLTVKHVLIECVDTADTRKQFFNCPDLKTLFNSVAGNTILAFLAEVNLKNKF